MPWLIPIDSMTIYQEHYKTKFLYMGFMKTSFITQVTSVRFKKMHCCILWFTAADFSLHKLYHKDYKTAVLHTMLYQNDIHCKIISANLQDSSVSYCGYHSNINFISWITKPHWCKLIISINWLWIMKDSLYFNTDIFCLYFEKKHTKTLQCLNISIPPY